RRRGPFQGIDGAEGDVYGEAFGSTEVAFERVRLPAEGVHVSGSRALISGLSEQFCVGGIQAVEAGAVVSGEERGDQMVGQTDVKRVAPERRPVLFTENKQGPARQIGRRVLASTSLKVLPVEDTVVFVGYQRADDVHTLCGSRFQQVLQRV